MGWTVEFPTPSWTQLSIQSCEEWNSDSFPVPGDEETIRGSSESCHPPAATMWSPAAVVSLWDEGMEGQGCCCPLPFTYFPHGKSIQVVADSAGRITLPGLRLVVLTCQRSTEIRRFCITPVRALQKRMELRKGNLLVKGPWVLIPHFPKLINVISGIGTIAQVIIQCPVVRLPVWDIGLIFKSFLCSVWAIWSVLHLS